MATPLYSNIFPYTNYGMGGGNFTINSSGGENSNIFTVPEGTNREDWQLVTEGANEGNSGNSYYKYTPPSNLANLMNLTPVQGGTDQTGLYNYNMNFRGLPNQGMTKYGPVEYMMPSGTDPSSMKELRNPNYQYYDTNFGQITPSANRKPDTSWQGSIVPWAGKLAMMGMGGLMTAGLNPYIKGAISAGKGFLNSAIQDSIATNFTSPSALKTSGNTSVGKTKYTGPMPQTSGNSTAGKIKYTGPMPKGN